jgi:hypothetical protein
MEIIIKNLHVRKAGLVSIVVFFAALFLGATALVPQAGAYSASPQHHGNQVFFAVLRAAPGVKTQATGITIFWLGNGGTALHYILLVHNLRNVFMAHIHFKDGTIITWLYPNPNFIFAEGQTDCLAVLTSHAKPSTCSAYIPGAFTGLLVQGTLTAANIKALDDAGWNGMTFSQMINAMASGNAYVNVHTVQNPAGEIQGYIEP